MSARLRLAVALARAGVASRRAADRLIAEGRVAVNGETVEDAGRQIDPGKDAVTVDGAAISEAEALRHYALNKPRGVLSAASDARGRRTVVDFLPADAGRCVPVGRLDLESEGLILLTNDGPLITTLLHPSSELPRTYLVEVEERPSDGALDRIFQGVPLEDGSLARAKPKRSKRPGRGAGETQRVSSWLTLTLQEGRKREVRQMCKAIGHPVLTLRRTRFGPVLLRDLAPGTIRPLDGREIRLLRRAGQRGLRAKG